MNHTELSVRTVNRNLGISSPMYYLWKKLAEENNGQVRHNGLGNYAFDIEEENARLRRELKNSQDVLKKS